MTCSPAIDEAVASAESEGNAIVEISSGWTEAREVVHMKRPASDRLRARIARDKRLRYWTADRTPHTRAECGFTDDREKISISFPIGG